MRKRKPKRLYVFSGCLQKRHSVTVDNNKSLNYYKKSFLLADIYCQQNSKDACKTLSFLYENGLGVEKDLNRADSASEKSCDLGDAQVAII